MDKQEWWVWVAAGVVAIALSLWVLFAPGQASYVVGLAAAVYLLAAGAIGLIGELTTSRRTRSSLQVVAGIVGVVVGAVILWLAIVEWTSLDTAWTILAIGLVVSGGLGLFIALFARQGAFDWGPVVVNALLVLWGVLVFVARSRETELATWAGWILLGVGIVGVAWGLFARTRAQ
jgi:uncharacterized membrane protein HdeD (DUF308 family)